MKYRIAYIELDTHAEVLNQFYELTKNSTTFDVDFYVSDKINKLVRNQDFEPIVTDANKIIRLLNGQDYDLVIIGTVHRYFKTFLKIVRAFSTAVLVHNLNFAKSESADLLKAVPLDDSTYRTKLLLLEGLLSVPKVYTECDYQLVLDENMSDDKHLFLPLYYLKNTSKTRNPIPKVVIPGAVSQNRRDYNKVIQVLQKAKQPLDVYFLGKAEGEELKAIQALVAKPNLPLKLHFYTQKLSNSEFQKILSKADVLWCPIQTKTSFFSLEEIYGKTKSSGNLGDAITFGKKAIFPKSYTSHYPFIVKEADDILAQLNDVLMDTDYDFEKNYSYQNIQKKLEDTLVQMIQKS